MMLNAILIGGFWMVYFVITIASYYVTEKLVKPFNYWDVYPFKCRKCLSTWSLLASYVSIGLIVQNYIFLGAGVLLTIMNAIALWYTDKERFLEE